MRRILVALVIFYTAIETGLPQSTPFSLVPVTLKPMEYSSCAWGDYDNDGDLDAVLSGASTAAPITCLYQNNSGVLAEVGSGLPGFSNTSIEWGDYDKDGDLDLLITGMDMTGEYSTKIFNNAAGTFSDAGVILPGVSDGQAAWGDLDNDGDLDILLAGNNQAKIIRNDGNNQFTEVSAPLTPVINASCSWVDYNNDGQLDATISGDSIGGMLTRLYKNNQGQFTEVIVGPTPFMGLNSGKCKWADMDGDGRQDLVLSGMDMDANGHLVVYRNNGNDQFEMFDNMTTNVRYSSLDIGDYDGDGLPDIIFMGKVPGCGGTAVTMLFQNLGFMQFFEIGTDIPGYSYGDVKWGDFNNDGYSDILITGVDGYFAPTAAIFKNNAGTGTYKINTAPSTPDGLTVEPLSGGIVLRWNSADDNETPKQSITYNISIGTQPGFSDIFSAMADETTGYRRIAAQGNCTADTSWTITGISSGDYWFSVQALDNGFLPGSFATPVPFTYNTPVGFAETPSKSLHVYPNPCQDQVRVMECGIWDLGSGIWDGRCEDDDI